MEHVEQTTNNEYMTEHWLVGNVLATRELDFFKFHPDNRAVNGPHMRRVKKSIKENGLLDPIKVTTDGYILNGQHRYVAIKELHKDGIYEPIKYIVVETEADVKALITLNAIQKELTLNDYIEMYAKNGQEQYQQIVEIAREHKITPSAVVSIMFGGGNSSKHTQMVKYGQDLNFDDWDLLKGFLDWSKELNRYTILTLKTRQIMFAMYGNSSFSADLLKEKLIREYNNIGQQVRFSNHQNICKKQLLDMYNKGTHRSNKNYINYVQDADGKIRIMD